MSVFVSYYCSVVRYRKTISQVTETEHLICYSVIMNQL